MWPPFKKKNEADLRTLNEKEIQQKLYGHYFLPKTSVGSDDLPSHNPQSGNSKLNSSTSSNKFDENVFKIGETNATNQNLLDLPNEEQIVRRAAGKEFPNPSERDGRTKMSAKSNCPICGFSTINTRSSWTNGKNTARPYARPQKTDNNKMTMEVFNRVGFCRSRTDSDTWIPAKVLV